MRHTLWLTAPAGSKVYDTRLWLYGLWHLYVVVWPMAVDASEGLSRQLDGTLMCSVYQRIVLVLWMSELLDDTSAQFSTTVSYEMLQMCSSTLMKMDY